MKWHIKIHAKIKFYQKEREVTFSLLLGVPLCALDLQYAAFATKGKLKKSLKK